jgi:hypothetical protein
MMTQGNVLKGLYVESGTGKRIRFILVASLLINLRYFLVCGIEHLMCGIAILVVWLRLFLRISYPCL